MCPANQRPYIERGPVETITIIQRILAEIGLSPEEIGSGNLYPGLHSARLSLPTSLGSYGTNGKGRSVEYCLASAYAEFLERMQNGLFHFLSGTMVASFRDRYGFYYTPDEQYLTEEQLLALPDDVIADLVPERAAGRDTFTHLYCERARANGAPGVVAVPFYDTGGQDVVCLPLNLLLQATGSNAMAAGNTLPEAIFQASCELLAFVLALIRLRLGQYDKARKSLQEFLDARQEKYRYAYYDRVSQYLDRRAEGLTHAQAAGQLAQDPEWGEQGRQVAEELADPREVFRFVNLPNCPDCGECELQPECITTGILSTVERVYPAMRHSRIDQMALAWVAP